VGADCEDSVNSSSKRTFHQESQHNCWNTCQKGCQSKRNWKRNTNAPVFHKQGWQGAFKDKKKRTGESQEDAAGN